MSAREPQPRRVLEELVTESSLESDPDHSTRMSLRRLSALTSWARAVT